MEETQRDVLHRDSIDQIPNLPEEVIHEIFLRLPVKSLLKFKSVSKSWRSLISSKDFARAHLEMSSRDRSSTRHMIVTTSFNLKQFPLDSLFSKPLTYAVGFDYPPYEPNDVVTVVGSCNGLVCIFIRDKGLMLWNPSTQQCKKLPPFCHTTTPEHSIFRSGFGYDESGDDYKVFAVMLQTHVSLRRHFVAKVYSLKLDCWRKIDDITTNLALEFEGKLASKNLHWIRGNGDKWEILSFDLVSEVFGSVDLPSSIDDHQYYPTLDELKGCLCLLCEYTVTRLDVWLLRQYGVRDSWDKFVTITYPCFPYPSYPCYGPFSGPFWVGDNGEVLFVFCDKNFALYYPKEAWFSHPVILNLDHVKKVNVYVESLLSPFP